MFLEDVETRFLGRVSAEEYLGYTFKKTTKELNPKRSKEVEK